MLFYLYLEISMMVAQRYFPDFREYKEALRQQRANEGPSVYRPREQVTPPGNESQNNAETADSASNKDAVALTGKQIFNEENATKRPVQKVTPSRINYQNTPIINGSNNEYNNKNGKYLEQPYKKPNSPIKTSSSILSSNTSPGHTPRLVKTAVGYVEGKRTLCGESEKKNGIRWIGCRALCNNALSMICVR